MSSRVRVGIALGNEQMTAVELRQSWRGVRPGRVWSWPVMPLTDDVGQAALAQALEELHDALGAAEVSASFALLRPLAQAKVIATPPIGRRALELLVQRNAQRYFIGAAEGGALVTASPVGTSSPLGRASSRAVAVYAAEQTVAAITAAADSVGMVVERITAAPLALREAVRALVPGVRRGRVLAIVGGTSWLEALLLDDDTLRFALPLPAASVADAESTARTVSRLIADGEGCGCRPERAMVISGDAAREDAALRIAADTDSDVSPLPVPPAIEQLTPAALAAFGASLSGGRSPLLVTDALRDARRRGTIRRTASLYAVAAVMLSAGAATHLWTLHGRLAHVEASRRALSASLAPAMAERRSVEAARTTLDALARVERESPRWTRVLAALAQALPESAYLVSLSTSGSKLQLTGLAESAHAVVAPLEASPAFADVTLSTASRRDPAARRERFELSASVDTSDVPRTQTTIVGTSQRTDR
jgi:Tfp pilus assembly protein PilN